MSEFYAFSSSLATTPAVRSNHGFVGATGDPASPSGYWLAASDGGVFSFGGAGFYGSTGAIRLNQPVVGMASDSSTGGYWLVASDGGVFSFRAPFLGSRGGVTGPDRFFAIVPGGGGYLLAGEKPG